ncbi:MAG: hypothetical protein J6K91_05950 [Opitutales bacterium]|nr:hypothetical protein [Opitutales bacterium]MBP3358438.1 hypothetical protein [Opitutales bacterium]
MKSLLSEKIHYTESFEKSERRAGKPINAIACAEIARAIKSVKLAKNKKGK